MLRITVKKKDGTMWAATQITAVKTDGGKDAVAFVCSGMMMTFLMDEVDEIVARKGI